MRKFGPLSATQSAGRIRPIPILRSSLLSPVCTSRTRTLAHSCTLPHTSPARRNPPIIITSVLTAGGPRGTRTRGNGTDLVWKGLPRAPGAPYQPPHPRPPMPPSVPVSLSSAAPLPLTGVRTGAALRTRVLRRLFGIHPSEATFARRGFTRPTPPVVARAWSGWGSPSWTATTPRWRRRTATTSRGAWTPRRRGCAASPTRARPWPWRSWTCSPRGGATGSPRSCAGPGPRTPTWCTSAPAGRWPACGGPSATSRRDGPAAGLAGGGRLRLPRGLLPSPALRGRMRRSPAPLGLRPPRVRPGARPQPVVRRRRRPRADRPKAIAALSPAAARGAVERRRAGLRLRRRRPGRRGEGARGGGRRGPGGPGTGRRVRRGGAPAGREPRRAHGPRLPHPLRPLRGARGRA